MKLANTAIVSAAAGFLCFSSFSAAAQFSDDKVRIGVLSDHSGAYADLSGPGSVVAAKMAVERFGGSVHGKPVDVVFADHQNKADIGASIARKWFDVDGVDVVVDFSNTAVGLAVQALAKQKDKITLVTASSTAFTGAACTKTSAQWAFTSYSNGYSLARAVTELGSKSWYLITVDYTFGHSFANDIRKAVAAAGGKVVGEVRHPLNTSDMSSYLLQAQASGAETIAFNSAGKDLVTLVKQAAEFGISKDKKIVAPIVFITDVHSLGLDAAQGLQFVTGFYWDHDEASRKWSQEFFARHGSMPTMVQSAVYSSIRHYLRAIEAAKTDSAESVMKKMKELPVNDPVTLNGWLRDDGQLMHDMLLVSVKKPSESKGGWDYYKVVSVIPGGKAFHPLSDSECSFVKKPS